MSDEQESFDLFGPKVRERVASVFDYINELFSHRVASTTGSHPTDPAKESRKNQLTPPLITFQTVNEALSVILSEGNITPRAAVGSAAPLELLQHHCATHFVRFVPQLLSQQWQPLIGSATVPLHWYRHESRMPHITFFYERYQGPGLLRVAGKMSHIRVMFDRRDIRTLHAISLNGEDLGELQVSTPWQRFPHTLGTRQWIHKNIKRFHFNAVIHLVTISDFYWSIGEIPRLPSHCCVSITNSQQGSPTTWYWGSRVNRK